MSDLPEDNETRPQESRRRVNIALIVGFFIVICVLAELIAFNRVGHTPNDVFQRVPPTSTRPR